MFQINFNSTDLTETFSYFALNCIKLPIFENLAKHIQFSGRNSWR